MLRIGMLTSGGDCQALNAAMRGVVKGLSANIKDLEVFGFEDGYKGLIYGNYRLLTSADFSGILTKGGTILGSSRQPFKLMRTPDANGLDKVEAMKSTYYKLNLDCLVILGGNGTQKTANLLREEGLNVIHLPKTIDNDIYGTDVTFGFQSAINIATDAIDCIHTTAASHNRVFIVEVMGHKEKAEYRSFFKRLPAKRSLFRAIFVAFLFFIPTMSARLAAILLRTIQTIKAITHSRTAIVQNVTDPRKKWPFCTKSPGFMLM